MGVGSIGSFLQPYEECDTFLSTDAGVNWKRVREGANKYEVGDQGGVLVMVDDEDRTSKVVYSLDFGQTWETLDMGITIRALLLTTVPDSTSQKFMLLGTLARGETGGEGEGRHAIVFLDFADLQSRKCGGADFEKWYVRAPATGHDNGRECVLGHKQWYKRRKPTAECYVGNKFNEEVGHEEDCICRDEDFECDFNYVMQDGECVMRGLEAVPIGQCTREGQKFMGSSGTSAFHRSAVAVANKTLQATARSPATPA
jgi:hypothetical protein